MFIGNIKHDAIITKKLNWSAPRLWNSLTDDIRQERIKVTEKASPPYSIGNSSRVIFKTHISQGGLDNSQSHSANVFRVDDPRSEPRVLQELKQKKRLAEQYWDWIGPNWWTRNRHAGLEKLEKSGRKNFQTVYRKMENTLHSVFQRYCQFALLWWTKSVDRSILLTARSIGTDLDTLVQILPSGSLRTWIQQPPHLNNCCAVPELMVQMGRQCCNELESCSDGKNWQSTLKLSYIRDWRGNAFKGDILWHFDFLTK